MVRPISAGVTSSSESGLDPVVRARLQRLIAEAGPRPASGEALPAAARAYLAKIETLCEIPIDIVSTGPERGETILRRHPFQ